MSIPLTPLPSDIAQSPRKIAREWLCHKTNMAIIRARKEQNWPAVIHMIRGESDVDIDEEDIEDVARQFRGVGWTVTVCESDGSGHGRDIYHIMPLLFTTSGFFTLPPR